MNPRLLRCLLLTALACGALSAGAAQPEQAFPPIKQSAEGYALVGFEHLASFAYPTPVDGAGPKAGSVEGIPENVRALDGRRVCIDGYMMPMKLEDGFVKEFLLIRSPMMCCYGTIPATNEWVVVRMKTASIAPLMDVPIKLYGTLRVGAVYEHDAFAGLYAVEGEKVVGP